MKGWKGDAEGVGFKYNVEVTGPKNDSVYATGVNYEQWLKRYGVKGIWGQWENKDEVLRFLCLQLKMDNHIDARRY